MSAGRADQAFLEEQLDLLVAEPLDVEGVARAEMLETLDRLRRADEMAGAAAHDVGFAGLLVDLAQRRRAADGTGLPGRRRASHPPARLSSDDLEDLRNDVARALHHDRVADAHVLAGDLVLVVQGGVGDDDAADRDGLELGDRGQRAGAPDLDLDRLEHGRRPLGGELVRDRPARAARDEAEPLLQREIVDLVDDAVDVVAEVCALSLDRAVVREHFRRRTAEACQRIGRQAEAPHGLDRPELRRRRRAR